MPFTAEVFGRKLSSLRADFGQDMNALSTATGISADRLGALEHGGAVPTGDEVLIIADHFRKDFRFLISDDSRDLDAGVDLLFRERGGDLPPSDRVAIAEFAYLCRCQAQLEAGLGTRPARPDFSFRPTGAYFKGHGESCARMLRQHLGLGTQEIVRDVFFEMRSMGFKVFRRRLENSNISGLFMNHPEAGPSILVNLAEGLARQRFSAAHEWAHGLLDQKPVTLSLVGEWNSGDLVEVRANTFASNFLIPPELLSSLDARHWADPKEVSLWANRLRVSVPALLSALVAAKKITDEQRERIRSEAPRPPEPPDPELEGGLSPTQLARKQALLERGLSKHYVDLCFDAYTRDIITIGLLAEMLLTTSAGTHEIACLFGRGIGHA
jgi:Zn-dependent peptidase ImmA (M78 family)